MVVGCCVCSDETGTPENPLVHCDGCNVAVHQACYGLIQVPAGSWFCKRCESQERAERVECKLCPSKDGAFKKTDNSGWAHVVCALYIPEVRVGNCQTMDPIILSNLPSDRFNKNCYLCEESKSGKELTGACMPCNKAGCKAFFHVTCAQAAGLLCEEAGLNNQSIKYCGYCRIHYQKLLSTCQKHFLTKNSNRFTLVNSNKDYPNIKPIPAFRPIPAEYGSSKINTPVLRGLLATDVSSCDDQATAINSSTQGSSLNILKAVTGFVMNKISPTKTSMPENSTPVPQVSAADSTATVGASKPTAKNDTTKAGFVTNQWPQGLDLKQNSVEETPTKSLKLSYKNLESKCQEEEELKLLYLDYYEKQRERYYELQAECRRLKAEPEMLKKIIMENKEVVEKARSLLSVKKFNCAVMTATVKANTIGTNTEEVEEKSIQEMSVQTEAEPVAESNEPQASTSYSSSPPYVNSRGIFEGLEIVQEYMALLQFREIVSGTESTKQLEDNILNRIAVITTEYADLLNVETSPPPRVTQSIPPTASHSVPAKSTPLKPRGPVTKKEPTESRSRSSQPGSSHSGSSNEPECIELSDDSNDESSVVQNSASTNDKNRPAPNDLNCLSTRSGKRFSAQDSAELSKTIHKKPRSFSGSSGTGTPEKHHPKPLKDAVKRINLAMSNQIKNTFVDENKCYNCETDLPQGYADKHHNLILCKKCRVGTILVSWSWLWHLNDMAMKQFWHHNYCVLERMLHKDTNSDDECIYCKQLNRIKELHEVSLTIFSGLFNHDMTTGGRNSVSIMYATIGHERWGWGGGRRGFGCPKGSIIQLEVLLESKGLHEVQSLECQDRRRCLHQEDSGFKEFFTCQETKFGPRGS